MKKIIALLVALVLVFALAACGSGGTTATEPPAENTGSETTGGETTGGETTTFEPMTWKLAMSGTETSTWMEAGQYFAELISDATGGAITVDCYPSDQLTSGSQTDGIQACMDGTTELSMHSNLIYSSFDDRFSVVSLPFLFGSVGDADEVLDGAGGDALQAVLGEYGLHSMGIAENGFRHVSNSKREITSPEDMEGLVIRVAGSSVLMEAYGAWGANYTKANWSEVYTGLQTGTYDGQENPIPTMDSASIQEVQTYVTYWTGAYDCLFFVINADLYNSLSPELQAIVDDCGQQACEYEREINRAGDEAILSRWESENGMTVHYLTDDEMVAFKAKSDPVYDIYAQMLLDNGYDTDFVTNYLSAFGVAVDLG